MAADPTAGRTAHQLLCYYHNLMINPVLIDADFKRLIRDAAHCRLCERMCERRAVLSEKNGSLRPRVMFIAEAPGRRGGDRTRIPLTGDLSGRNFETFLASTGLTREEIFITNAVLCNPREGERNARPSSKEISNCRRFLARQIDLLRPPVVVTLGAVALKAIEAIEPHGLELARDVGSIVGWYGRKLIPLYHPSPHVVNGRRKQSRQIEDYQAIPDALMKLGKGCK
jgi:uracil-DNA glycosylase